MMKRKEVYTEFFQAYLPQALKEKIDVNKLALSCNDFIGEGLRSSACDLLFTTNMGEESDYIYFITEAQTNAERLMTLREWKYALHVMEQHADFYKTDVLPVVYPIVLYTGKKPYHYSMDFLDLFGKNKELMRSILYQPFQLIDLSQQDDAMLLQTRRLALMTLVMKHIKNLKPILPRLRALLAEAINIGQIEMIHDVLYYIVGLCDKDTLKSTEQALRPALINYKGMAWKRQDSIFTELAMSKVNRKVNKKPSLLLQKICCFSIWMLK